MTFPVALIPYVQIPVVNLGPLPLDPWGVLVTLGFMVGLEVARARGIRLGLEVKDVVDGLVFTVLSGFVFGHVINVVAYHPDQLGHDATTALTALLKVWGGFSSFGGFLGAVIGITLFYKRIRKLPFWPHADTIMYGFPFGWVFGRLGCFSVHDHRGIKSTFPLAVNFPDGPRLDMGLLEALWTMGICVLYFTLSKRPYRPGTFALLWCFVYAPARFGFDFLRNTDLSNADVRWSGLTPAQWGCIVLVGAGLALLPKVRRTPIYVPSGSGGEPAGGGVQP